MSNGKRTTRSNGKTNKSEAIQYLDKFKNTFNKPSETSTSLTQEAVSNNTLTLSQFKLGYLEYAKPVKSKKYLDSITYTFNSLLNSLEIFP